MKKEIFDTLPYISRKELIDLRNYMKVAFESNAHIIYEDPAVDAEYQFKDITGQYAFNIRFGHFEESQRHNVYVVYYIPAGLSTMKGAENGNTLEQIKTSFSSWIDIVKSMFAITQQYYDPHKKFYDEQFANFFTNNDEDATINPFEIGRQEILYYFLTYAEKTIEKRDDIPEKDKAELLNDVSKLKDDIPLLTKKRFVSALSKFAEKTKKVSNKLFHDVFDILKKEMIKEALLYGLKNAPKALNDVQHWIHVFIQSTL